MPQHGSERSDILPLEEEVWFIGITGASPFEATGGRVQKVEVPGG